VIQLVSLLSFLTDDGATIDAFKQPGAAPGDDAMAQGRALNQRSATPS
jgi:hypothetical protein